MGRRRSFLCIFAGKALHLEMGGWGEEEGREGLNMRKFGRPAVWEGERPSEQNLHLSVWVSLFFATNCLHKLLVISFSKMFLGRMT